MVRVYAATAVAAVAIVIAVAAVVTLQPLVLFVFRTIHLDTHRCCCRYCCRCLLLYDSSHSSRPQDEYQELQNTLILVLVGNLDRSVEEVAPQSALSVS